MVVPPAAARGRAEGGTPVLAGAPLAPSGTALRERGLSRARSPRPLPRWWCPLRRLAGEWELRELRELDSDELERSERELEEGDREGDDRE